MNKLLALSFICFLIPVESVFVVPRPIPRPIPKPSRSVSNSIIKPGPRQNVVLKGEYLYTKYWYPYIIINRDYKRDYPVIEYCNSTIIEEHDKCLKIYNSYYDNTNCTSAIYNIISQADKCLTDCNSTEIDTNFFEFGLSINQSLYEKCNYTFEQVISSINSSDFNNININIIFTICFYILFILI